MLEDTNSLDGAHMVLKFRVTMLQFVININSHQLFLKKNDIIKVNIYRIHSLILGKRSGQKRTVIEIWQDNELT